MHSAEKKIGRRDPLVSSGYVDYLNQSRICGKGVSLGIFPSDSLQSQSYEFIEIAQICTYCNVRQSALQKFLKISIKNSKCAVSNKHIQDGRPGRYENRRGSKIKAKHHQKDPTHHPGTRMSEMSSPRRRENQEFGHLTAKRQGFGRKVPNETIVPRR